MNITTSLPIRFQGIYAIATLTQGTDTVTPASLPKRVTVVDTYTENPRLAKLGSLFQALNRLGKQGSDANVFKVVDEPDSRVFSPEDIYGPYLYSTQNYVLTNDSLGNHLEAWQREVERPAERAAEMQRLSGKLSKAPPGYAERRRLTGAFFQRYQPEACRANVRLDSAEQLTVTPEQTDLPTFSLTV